MTGRWIVSSLLVLVLSTPFAEFSLAAGDRALVKAAKQHFKIAETHYRLSRFQQALDEYSKAYELKPLPAFLFNIAQCHMELSNFERAIFFYEGYLRDAKKPTNRAMVEDLLKDARQALAAQERAADEERKRQAVLAQENQKQEELARQERERQQKAEAERLRLEAEKVAVAKAAAEVAVRRTVAPAPVQAPFYKTWWFWTASAAVLGGGVIAAVLLTRDRTESVLPSGELGTIDYR